MPEIHGLFEDMVSPYEEFDGEVEWMTHRETGGAGQHWPCAACLTVQQGAVGGYLVTPRSFSGTDRIVQVADQPVDSTTQDGHASHSSWGGPNDGGSIAVYCCMPRVVLKPSLRLFGMTLGGASVHSVRQ